MIGVWSSYVVGSSLLCIILILLNLGLFSVDGEMLSGVGVFLDSLGLMLSMLTVWICLSIFMSSGIWEDLLCKGLVMSVGVMLIVCFSVGSIFWFYIFFEVVLIPMFLLVVLCGNYSERVESGFYMLFYTMFGSLPLLMMVVEGLGGNSWNFSMSILHKGYSGVEGLGSLMMMSAFFSKLPMYGLHIWLPKAHVEAPVVGSMLLAGVLLKLGGYGVMRVLCFLQVSLNLKSLVMVMGIVGGINCGLACLRQDDMKKLVAYSSVVHSGVAVSGMMTYLDEGWGGALMMMVCHGLCSSGLFFLVNMMYERVMSRSIMMIKGCGNLMPMMSMWCFLLIIMNMGCPPFLSFFSESLLCMGLLKWCFLLVGFLGIMLFISVGYNMYLYSIMNHGNNNLVMVGPVMIMEYLLLFLHFLPGVSLISKSESFLM